MLVPLSGPQATLGTALLNSAQLALFDWGDDSFAIQAFDTRGTPSGAQNAARQAIAQNVDIIIGPLLSTEVKAVSALASQAGIPVIAFTTDQAAAGNGVYLLSFPPGPQAIRVATHAANVGRMRLAVLAPATSYGQLIAATVQQNMPADGPQVVRTQFYDPAAIDWIAVANQLIGANDPAIDPGFDALLLADKGDGFNELIQALSVRGVGGDKVKLLGTMLWKDEKLGQKNPLLIGAWYAAPTRAGHEDFDQRYTKAFGGRAPILASLGYDAIALAAILARDGQRDFSQGAITKPTGFMGTDGLFRLSADGSIERGYAIFEVDASGNDREITPAPGSFQALY